VVEEKYSMKKPIRVLQVFAQMNRGGAETMIMNLYRHMDHSEIQFDFIVHTDKKCTFDDEIQLLGGKIFNAPVYKGTNHLEYKKWWNSFFRNHQDYKIIHGHIRSTASIYLKIAKDYSLTTIAHSHNTSSGSGFSAIIKNILQYPIRYIADYLFACSKSAGIWLFGKNACTKDNFFILRNAIDTKRFIYDEEIRLKKRKEFKIESKFVIGHIGRFAFPKNHTFLVDIFKKVHDKYSDTVLMLIGDGNLRPGIEKKVANLQLTESVIFTGIRSDIPDILQAMDVFVFPSLYEGLPVTLIEAQASGLECIVSDKITTEVRITDLITFCSLKNSSDFWARKIISDKFGDERRDFCTEITHAGYDVKENARFLENFYLEHSARG